MRGHTSRVNCVRLNADATLAVSGSYDASVRCWDLRANTYANGGPLNSHLAPQPAHRLSCIPLIFCLSHVRSREAVQILDDAKDSVPSLALSEHEIVTGSVDGNLRCYDLRIGQLRTDCIDEPVTSVSMTHDSNCLLASSLDGTIRLFDKLTGDLLSEFNGHKNSVSVTMRERERERLRRR